MASADLLLPGRTLAAVLLGTGLLAGARADVYLCTTANGSVASGDTPPADCRLREIKVLNKDGSVKSVIPAPLTAAQREKRDETAKAKILQDDLDRIQARKDKALLETYGSVEEIEAARKRTLAMRQAAIDRADGLLRAYAKERKGLDDEAEFYARRQMPLLLKDKFDANQRLAQQQEKVKADSLVDMQRINEKFDLDARRFQQIVEENRKAMDARGRVESE